MASYSVLVSGLIAFKENIPKELRDIVIKEVEQNLGVNFELDEEYDEYSVLEWSNFSPGEEDLRNAWIKWKPLFSVFNVAIYYIPEPDYAEHHEDESEEDDANSIFTVAVDELCRMDIFEAEKFSGRFEALIALLKHTDVDGKLAVGKITELFKVMEREGIEMDNRLVAELLSALARRRPVPLELKKVVLSKLA